MTMANNLTEIIFNDSLYFGPRA